MNKTSFLPIILIPVYNHGLTIKSTLQKILSSTELPVILVNDGSEHSCSQVLKSLAQQHAPRVRLIEHGKNRGKGAAIQTGLRAAQQAGYSHALQVDADGQHRLSDIPRFIVLAQKNPTALICGYPIYNESVPKHRLYARYLTHIWVWINTLSLRIKDSMCGFRVYPLSSVIPLINRHSMFPRMSFDTEIAVRADWASIPIFNTPTQVIYPEDGVSQFLSVKDNVYITLMHTRLFFGMLTHSPHLLCRWFSDKPIIIK